MKSTKCSTDNTYICTQQSQSFYSAFHGDSKRRRTNILERCYGKLIISKIFFKFRIRNFRIKFESFEFGKIEFENFKFETFEFETIKFECFELESFEFESFEFENIEFHFKVILTVWGKLISSPKLK